MRRAILVAVLLGALLPGCAEGCDYDEGEAATDCPQGVAFDGVFYEPSCAPLRPRYLGEPYFTADEFAARTVVGVDPHEAVALQRISYGAMPSEGPQADDSCGAWFLGIADDVDTPRLRGLIDRYTTGHQQPETGEPN